MSLCLSGSVCLSGVSVTRDKSVKSVVCVRYAMRVLCVRVRNSVGGPAREGGLRRSAGVMSCGAAPRPVLCCVVV